jgi:2-iminobutanoate/2-iminopropanoate deaminase
MTTSMIRQTVARAPGLHDTRHRNYSSAVRVGPMVFIAGQCGLDDQGKVISPDFDPQAIQVLARVKSALESVGAGVADITNMTTFLTDPTLGNRFLELRREFYADAFPDGAFPASTTLAVKALLSPTALIEVQVQAVIADS